MNTSHNIRFIPLLFIWAVIGACGMLALPETPTNGADAIYTQAAQTIQANITQAAAQFTATAGAAPTEAQPTLAPTRIQPTLEPTALPEPTWTPVPTETPLPTATPTMTPVPIPCDRAQFVSDLSIQDGQIFTPGTQFTKSWRLKNTGSCTWTTDYDVVFVDGNKMGAAVSFPLPYAVRPGEIVDIWVNLQAPGTGGRYRGHWMLRNAENRVFGLGTNAETTFWVDIEVVTPRNDYAYDFALNFCSAQWRSSTGGLPCPGIHTDQNGFVQLLTSAALENRNEDEPTLWVHPDTIGDGWIRGTFPAYKVQSGDHFRAWVGCMADSKGCDVLFEVQVQINNEPVQSLGRWRETYDGEVSVIDIDLSELVGTSVKFILSVTSTDQNTRNDSAFWFVPHIQR